MQVRNCCGLLFQTLDRVIVSFFSEIKDRKSNTVSPNKSIGHSNPFPPLGQKSQVFTDQILQVGEKRRCAALSKFRLKLQPCIFVPFLQFGERVIPSAGHQPAPCAPATGSSPSAPRALVSANG